MDVEPEEFLREIVRSHALTSTPTIQSSRLPTPMMHSFILRFDDASRAFHKVTEQSGEYDALLDSWRVFRKIATHLDAGTADRLENLARRLGHLQQAGQRKQNGLKDHGWSTQGSSTKASPVPLTTETTQFTISRRKSHSRRSSSVVTVQNKTPTARSHIPSDPQFRGLDPISLLSAPHDLSSKPIIQLSLDIHNTHPPVPGTRNSNDTFTTFYENDPNELCILPSLSTPPPFSLQSIAEGSEEEFEHGPSTPRASSPVLFVNPFGAPTRNDQLPSPPQTPSLSECIPPHLNDDEEEEDSLSRSEPINLTGRVKKLMDPPIALGGTSDIFYGEWQLPAPKRVAVKVLRTTSTNSVTTVQRRLRREMRLWWMCRHRNVVPLYGYASDFGGMDAMISPWMKNGSALTYIKAQKCSWAERLKMLGDIVAGLKYLHHFEPPIVHGDLKPTNVLISDNGDACLCDFGLSRIIKSEAGPSGFTTSNFAGSIRYMSPELLNSEDEEALPLVTAASDVYALGCVGLEIVTDHIPYANRNLDAQVMHDIIRGIPPSRRPSLLHSATTITGGGGGAKHSLPKFWDLMTATWAPSPLHRPDIVQVARLLAECRTPHVGPQLSSSAHLSSTQMGSSTLGTRVPSRSSSSSLSSTLSVVRRGRQESAFRVSTSAGGAGVGVGRPSIHDEKPVPVSASVLKRSLSAGSTPVRNGPFPPSTRSSTRSSTPNSSARSSTPTSSHLQPYLSLRPTSATAISSSSSTSGSSSPSIRRSGSRSGSASTPTSTSAPGSNLLSPSDTLHRLRRSTSAAGAVLRGTLIHKKSVPTGAGFRPSVNAVEQVWYDG